jgi:hypothetical protein
MANKIGIQDDDAPKQPWWARVLWLIFIWSLSVLALGAVAFAIKKFMHAAGMST